MKTFTKFLAGAVTILAFAMIGCQTDTDTHEHTYSTDWTSDATSHWHAATCEHTTEVKDKATHSFNEGDVTKPATETEKGEKIYTCSVCGYVKKEAIPVHTHTYSADWTSDATNHWHAATCEHKTEVSEKAAHTFGEAVVTKPASETETGIKTYTCTVCKYEKTESIAVLPHTHKYSADWANDATGHWHAATCEHYVKSDEAAHTFDKGVVTKEATEAEEGEKTYTCTVCKYKKTEAIPVLPSISEVVSEGFVKVTGTKITGTETWTPTSDVFVRGRVITFPTLIVSDHEVTRGEFKEVMGTDPSTAPAYDANGTELTGDAVLNNPVNYVNWYAAIAYCNKLSIKEGLTPCYTVKDVDFATLKYSDIPTYSNSTWDVATCDFTANGYRLPTEAEWEYLARGGENYKYAGSNTVGDVAWYTSNIKDTGTREVKTKQANAYGLYDMSGNVWEWCWDLRGSINSTTDSAGSASGSYRVRRGGSWGSLDSFCAVSYRFSIDPYDRGSSCGLRVVRNAN